MKLAIITDNPYGGGLAYIVADDLEEYNLDKIPARAELCNEITKMIRWINTNRKPDGVFLKTEDECE